MHVPKISQKNHQFIEHGFKRNDPYYWLREKENPEVIAHLSNENDYTKFKLKHTESFQETLFHEMKNRIKEDDSSVPYFKNEYWYYSRYKEGQEYAIYARKHLSLIGEEEVLLDENSMAEGHDYYEIVSFSISPNNQFLVFAEDITGRRQYQLRVKDLKTGEVLRDLILGTGSDLAWHKNSSQFYYVIKDPSTLRPYQVKMHHLNTPNDNDDLIYTELDEAYITGVSKEKNGRFVFIGSWSTLTTEYRYLDLDANKKDFQIFHPRTLKLEYYPEAGLDGFYIKHNRNAKNFALSFCRFDKVEIGSWETIQPHDNEILLEDFEVFKNHLVVHEKVNGLAQLRVYNFEKKSNKVIPPKEDTFMLYLDQNPVIDATKVRIKYSSLTTPTSVIDIDLDDFSETILKVQPVIGEFKSENYQSERIWGTGDDGTKVPVSLVYKKTEFKKDGTNPLLLYGYGSYGSTIDPYFSSIRLTLLDRGFVFAIAHIRGSEYLGTNWYEDGKFLKKKNTFTDFIACAQTLVYQNYVCKDKVFAMGGSAGGLLMGAVANLNPSLWAGIISNVPFVDVVTTMMDETIPLTTGEYEEWGNPNDPEYFFYMLSYSPYDSISAQNYPPMLITSGLHDSQVQYWEPTKYVAKIRESKTDQNDILLHTNMSAGHGGASGRFESLKEVALEYAFILDLLDMQK
ncbi:MAG: S9 family peptidase [Crocinitomicaceae bacterium]